MTDDKHFYAVPPSPPAQLSAKEAADLTGVSPPLIYKLCRDRVLPHTRVGPVPGRGPVRISQEDLRAFLAARRVEPGRDEDLTSMLKHLKVS